MLIGIYGNQSSGKDTVSNILIKEHNFVKLSFASILKDVVSIMFGWKRELLEGITKESRVWRETKDEWWSNKLEKNITPRIILQELGTDVFRNNFEKNIWIYCLENKLNKLIKSNKNIVISDCRFINEINMIKKLNGTIIKINRNQIIDKLKLHSSELELNNLEPSFILNNNGSITELNNKIKNILNKIK